MSPARPPEESSSSPLGGPRVERIKKKAFKRRRRRRRRRFPCWCLGSGADSDWATASQAPCHVAMLMPVLSHPRWAKNICPGVGNMRGRCVLCLYQPALITVAQHPVMDPAQGIVEDGEIEWCKTERRRSHSHAIIAGKIGGEVRLGCVVKG